MNNRSNILSNDTENDYRKWLKDVGLNKENGYDNNQDYQGIDDNARAFYNMNGPVQISHRDLSRYLDYYPWINMEQQQLLQKGGQPEIPHDPDITGPISFLKSYIQSPEFHRKDQHNQFPPEQIQQMVNNLSKVKGYVLPDNYTSKTDGETLGSRAWDPNFLNAVNKGSAPDKQLQVPSDINIILDPIQAKEVLYPGLKHDQIRKHLDNDIYAHEAGHLMNRELSPIDELNIAFYNKDKQVQKVYNSPQYKKYMDDTRVEEAHRVAEGLPIRVHDRSLTNFLKSQMDQPGQIFPNKVLHDASPDENYADLSSFRYLMYRQGIYDARKGQLNPDQLNKAMKDPFIKESFPFKRLLKTFGKDNLIKLNNELASQGEGSSDQAKQGGSIKVSTEGYKNDSPDRFAPELVIPSGNITMKGVSHPVIGMDEHGMRVMLPGEDYQFSGSEVHEIPIKQMGGMLLRDREYQAGGQPQPTPKPDSTQLVNKYGRYVDGRTVWLDWAGRKMGDSTIKDMTSQAATTQKLNPAILYASAMEEGLQQRVNHPDVISQSYYDNVGAKSKDYPVDGFNAYGLDTFSDQFNTLVKKGYLKPEFKDKFLPFEGINEQNKKVNTAAFRDDASALQAKAAMMAYSRDRLSEYAQRKSINLTPEAQNFFTMSAYNLGDTGVQKMMDYFQKQGLLKDNAFLKTAPKLYKQVYDHVMPRIQGANMLQGEHVFQEGGEYKEGGSIHIKPSHRGRFTAWAKKHGMSVSEAAHHVMSNKGNYSSSVVKMANFAKNFAQVGMEVKPTPIQNVQDINEHTQAYLDESQAPKPGINYLPFLNIFNRVLGSVSDSMRSNEQNFQARQQAVFQSQQDSYTPRGRDQYGNPTIYQAGGVIDEDRSYLAPLPQIPSFNEQGPSFSSAPVSIPTNTPTRALRLPAVKSDVNVDDKAEFAFNYYRQRGVDPKVAAGIVGNLAVESNFNPKAKGDNGQATGIAQWHPERWNGLKKWAAQNGSDPFALTTQLEYILHEPGWADKSLHATSGAESAEAAAYTFGKTFERPNDKFANWGKRMGVAQKIHSKYLPQQQETYKAGGEYEMSDEQIAQLEKQGYKLERI